MKIAIQIQMPMLTIKEKRNNWKSFKDMWIDVRVRVWKLKGMCEYKGVGASA